MKKLFGVFMIESIADSCGDCTISVLGRLMERCDTEEIAEEKLSEIISKDEMYYNYTVIPIYEKIKS